MAALFYNHEEKNGDKRDTPRDKGGVSVHRADILRLDICRADLRRSDGGARSYFVNFRHTFYGLALLEKYKDTQPFRPFLVYALADEPFTLAVATDAPEGMERRYFYFGQTLLLYIYWAFLTAAGGLLGRLITFDTTGLDFALNALFLVFFLQQWKEKSNRPACLIGVAVTLASRIAFGPTVFLIPALIAMLLIFWLGRNRL